MVTARVTVENEYLSLLLSVDGLRHPMFRGLPVQRDSEDVDFSMTRAQFLMQRTSIIEGSYATSASKSLRLML